MNEFLHTFFFGYLSHKWRRLTRTLASLSLIYVVIFVFEEEGNTFEEGFPFIVIAIIFIALISWVIKPFVAK